MIGGRRPGSGRKLGSATQKTREAANRLAKTGIVPLEVMVSNMRYAHGLVAEAMAKGNPGARALKSILRLVEISQAAARDAAPYMHPRLSSIDIDMMAEHRVHHVIKPVPLTEDEWAVKHGVQVVEPEPGVRH